MATDISTSKSRRGEINASRENSTAETIARNNEDLKAGYLAIKSSIDNFKESDNRIDTLTEGVGIAANLLEYLKATAVSISTPYIKQLVFPWLVDEETFATATNVQNGLGDLLMSAQMVANTMKFLEEKVKLGQEEVRRKENELMEQNNRLHELLDIKEVENERMSILLDRKEALLSAMKEECKMMALSVHHT